MSFSGENLYTNARKKYLKDFDKFNKNYYKLIEDYDWIKVVSSFLKPESFYHYFREKTSLKYIKSVTKSKHLKALDAGCGTGLILRHLSSNSIGIDINPRHVYKARTYCKPRKIYLRDIENTKFRSDTFNIIVCFETLEHILYPEKVISEFKRILKSGGVLIGSVPFRSPLWLLRILSFSHPHNEPFHREFNEKEFRTLLDNKLKLLKLQKEIFGLNLYFIAQKK
ncbi:MAG: class I SAM-dependent methyltransferase [bacterium]|nr:class I SAM-dependent methyltransferase [bacterium]